MFPDPARDEVALEQALLGHGGRANYHRVSSIDLLIRRLSGPIVHLKGLSKTFPHPRSVTVWPHEQKTIFHDYPHKEDNIVFERGSLRADGVDSPNYRETMSGLRKLRRWKPADAAYFFGYALSNYLALPFLISEQATSWRRTAKKRLGFEVDVDFPDHVHTHSRKQRMYFDPHGRIVRHDYRADVLGPMFWGANFSLDYDEEHGLPIAKRRIVRLRLGRWATPWVVLRADVDVQEVRFDEEASQEGDHRV